MVRQQRSFVGVSKDFWYRSSVWVATTGAVLFTLSALTNVVGAVAFASLLATATLASIYDAIMLWIFVAVFFGAVTVALRTTTLRNLLIVRYHSDRIRSVVFRLIRVVAVVVWVGTTLDDFGFLGQASQALKSTFLYEFHLGEFSLSVSSVVIFIVAIWLSVKLSHSSLRSRRRCAAAARSAQGRPGDDLQDLDLSRGDRGFVVAIGAAGLDLSKFTIVVGALGVGIGFGLQNAVNNFVSGSDSALRAGRSTSATRSRSAEVSGVVKDIGIRATVVQTWQGAEVIVPNATLISENLVNWTLSDDAAADGDPGGGGLRDRPPSGSSSS